MENKEITAVKKQVQTVQSMVDDTAVTNQDELNLVADKIQQVKAVLKVIEDKKKKYTEPANAILREARETYDPMIKQCRNAEIVLKDKAKRYMLAEQDKQRIEQERIATRVEKGTMKIETAARKMEAITEAPKTVRTDTGSGLRMAKRKVATIVDPELIPDEYWIIDEVRVRREALDRNKNGQEQIPGVKITEEADLSSIRS